MEQVPGHFHVQHTDFIHQNQVGIQLLRQFQSSCLAGGQAQRLMDGAGGQAGTLLQSPRSAARRRAANDVCIWECFAVDI